MTVGMKTNNGLAAKIEETFIKRTIEVWGASSHEYVRWLDNWMFGKDG
jgi:hypothetical protein